MGLVRLWWFIGDKCKDFFYRAMKKGRKCFKNGVLVWEIWLFLRRERRKSMSYSEMAQLELMNAINSIRSEAELNEFKDLVARYFAEKAQKAIDALWEEGTINEEVIEQWGTEHMRTPYRYAAHRS
jgi:hypothetical protein